jgi:hypothetical protein
VSAEVRGGTLEQSAKESVNGDGEKKLLLTVVRRSKCVVKPVSVRNGKPGKASNGERRDCC